MGKSERGEKMREIKFKVWDIDEKCWIPTEICHLDSNGKLWTYEPSEGRWIIETISYEIVFYTGKKDKNGKQIFKGNIWERSGTICLVTFNFSQWQLRHRKGPIQYPYFHSNASTGKIIGSIFENPELLEA